MLDCVAARRPTPPAYSAGLQRGLGRSQTAVRTHSRTGSTSRSSRKYLLPVEARPSIRPPLRNPSLLFEEKLSDHPLRGEALRMCMLFPLHAFVLMFPLAASFVPIADPFLLFAGYLSR
jgi:hypothetical protein